MASEYIHEGNQEKADSLIQIVQQLFPKGIYVSKKNKVESKKLADKSVEEEYKEAYFLSTIGNWTALKNKETNFEFNGEPLITGSWIKFGSISTSKFVFSKIKTRDAE